MHSFKPLFSFAAVCKTITRFPKTFSSAQNTPYFIKLISSPPTPCHSSCLWDVTCRFVAGVSLSQGSRVDIGGAGWAVPRRAVQLLSSDWLNPRFPPFILSACPASGWTRAAAPRTRWCVTGLRRDGTDWNVEFFFFLSFFNPFLSFYFFPYFI